MFSHTRLNNAKVTMSLKELEELNKMNELDLLYKIIDVANDTKKRAEQLIKGNNIARAKVREKMQDIKLLADQIRSKAQIRKGLRKKIMFQGQEIDDTPIDRMLVIKTQMIEKEDRRIAQLEEKRKNKGFK